MCSNALRNDLQHPNEYVRGCTLRFLCKLKQVELVEPLSAAVRQCLDHKHPYVRRNAILAVNWLYKSFDYLIPDAPELIFEKFIGNGIEGDALCIRNALAMLSTCQPQLVTDYLVQRYQVVSVFDSEVQLVILDHVRRNMADLPDLSFEIYRQLLASVNPSVKYEAAVSVMMSLKDHSEAGLIAGEVLRALVSLSASVDSDDNIKLIALENISRLQEDFPDVMEDEATLLDILRALSSSDLQVRRKALDVVVRGISGVRGEEVLGQLKRELGKVSDNDQSQNAFRSLLLDGVYELVGRFPDLSSSALSLFMDYLTSGCDHYTDQVTLFIKYHRPSFQLQCTNWPFHVGISWKSHQTFALKP
jgi:coatomer subunit beta